MKQMIIPLCLFGSITSYGQEVIASGGTSFSNSDGSVEWTIGEPVIETLESNSNFATQGFHQTQLQVTAIDESNTYYDVAVFPNPTQGNVEIQIKDLTEDLSIKIFDVAGKLIMQKPYQMHDQTQTFDLSKIESGSYYLQLTGKEKIKTFTIIKH
ncbi:MAG: T9SS type A sorting domain-containing protein [Flavobacteriales bacterium]|jgi:hypothetical protein|nr:T9SS type A sorting domain-containing protein [Flavobacteriales bacterium]